MAGSSTAQFAHKRYRPPARSKSVGKSVGGVEPPHAEPAQPPTPALRAPSLPPPTPVAKPAAAEEILPPIPRRASAPPLVSRRSGRRPVAPIASLKAPAPFVPPSAGKSTRPTLSEQLAACRTQSENLLGELRTTFNVSEQPGAMGGAAAALCTLSPRSVRVGTRTCEWPGMLKFHDDHCTYYFQHPVHRKVTMVMYYRDMSGLDLRAAGGPGGAQLRFRIERTLEYFVTEYDHLNPAHHLSVTLASAADARMLRSSDAWARMKLQCRSSAR